MVGDQSIFSIIDSDKYFLAIVWRLFMISDAFCWLFFVLAIMTPSSCCLVEIPTQDQIIRNCPSYQILLTHFHFEFAFYYAIEVQARKCQNKSLVKFQPPLQTTRIPRRIQMHSWNWFPWSWTRRIRRWWTGGCLGLLLQLNNRLVCGVSRVHSDSRPANWLR